MNMRIKGGRRGEVWKWKGGSEGKIVCGRIERREG